MCVCITYIYMHYTLIRNGIRFSSEADGEHLEDLISVYSQYGNSWILCFSQKHVCLFQIALE